jgi:hypothetical protein
MQRLPLRATARFRDVATPPSQAAVGALMIGMLRIARFLNPIKTQLSEDVNAAGQIDIRGTMQAVTSVIEGWIREYPDQWLRLHCRSVALA